MSRTVPWTRWHLGIWIWDNADSSLFHLFQWFCKSSGISSSHPRFSFHNFCKIFLASRMTGQTNPIGSYSELTADRIPRFVDGWWGTRTLNRKASFSTSHWTPNVLSTGRFSRSKSRVGLARSPSGISDSTSRLLLIHFISLNPTLLSKHVTSFANELASFTVPTDLTKSST